MDVLKQLNFEIIKLDMMIYLEDLVIFLRFNSFCFKDLTNPAAYIAFDVAMTLIQQ